MPSIKSQDGTEIYFYDWGTGRPVVLIHGWPLTSSSWEYQARVLAESGFRVIAYDRRGFGRSGSPFGGYDYDTLAGDLHALLENLDLRDAALVGFSMGGGEVARYIANYGTARVSKVVFLASVTPYLLKTADNPDGVDKAIFDGIVESLERDRFAYLRQFSKSFYGNHASDAFLDFNQSMVHTASPRATIQLVRSWSETDFREDLRKVTVPALIMQGTADTSVPIELSGRKTAALLPSAKLLEYEGEPHGLIVTAAEKINADLLKFLAE